MSHSSHSHEGLSRTAQRLMALQGDDVSGSLQDIAAMATGRAQGEAEKMLSADELKKMARKHGGETAGRLLDAAEKLPQIQKADGSLDFGQISAMAEHSGASGHLADFLKQLDKTAGDPEKIAEVPGVVVDRETGKAELFGIKGLEVPPQYATILAGGYTYFLNVINGVVWDKAYKLGETAGAGFKLDAAMSQRAGLAAAYAAIAGTTHWIDINKFIQGERQYKNDYKELAQSVAPILQDLTGSHNAAGLFAVRQQDNELIYNERQRMHNLNNAERFRNLVHAGGRAVQYVVSAVEGHDRLNSQGFNGAVGAHASASLKKANESDAYLDQVRERMNKIKQTIGDMPPEKLYELAERQLGGEPHSKEAMNTLQSQIMQGGALISTFAAELVGNSLFGTRVTNIQPISAYDMIQTLAKQLDNDPAQERFKLPKGMSIEGAKNTNSDSLPLTDYIIKIFEQHEKDCEGGRTIAKRLQDPLREAAQIISKALRAGDLEGLALVKLVGERRVVKNSGKAVVTAHETRAEVQAIEAEMQHLTPADPREWLQDSSFSREQLAAAANALSDNEKSFFYSIVPPDVLVDAGIGEAEINQFKHANAQVIKQDLSLLSTVIQQVASLDNKQLEELSNTKREITLLHDAARELQVEGQEALDNYLPRAGHRDRDITRPLANTLVHYVLHEGSLAPLMQHTGRE